MTSIIRTALLCASIALASALPREEASSMTKAERLPTFDNDLDDDFPTINDEENSDNPFMMRIIDGLGRIVSSVMQLPSLMTRAFNFFVTTQPLARLREEMRNLNISYPKSGLLF